MQHRMAGAVCGGASALHRRAFAHILHMAAKGALIDGAIVIARERYASMFQFVNGRRRFTHHIFNRILITQPVRALYGVVHVPCPMVGRVILQARRNPALCSNGVAARRENFGDTRSFQTSLGSAHGCTQARATCADNNDVIGVIDNLIRIRHQAGAPVKACLATMKMPNAAAPMT